MKISAVRESKKAWADAKKLMGDHANSTIARALGMKRQAVWQWQWVPSTRVLAVERVTGVPRHELRPDIYPAP